MNATRGEKLTIYSAGLVQGITLVTFPAASTIFTSKADFGLSASQYGAMFLPQVILAISAALAGPKLSARFGGKTVYLSGLTANAASMLLLVASRFVMTDQAAAYPVLLAATAFLGLGFGLTVPAVNTFTAQFHPGAVDRSVLVLNALLGLGTALAPVFVAIFTGLGAWVGLPILAAVLLAVLIAISARLPLRQQKPATAPAGQHARQAPAGQTTAREVPAGVATAAQTTAGMVPAGQATKKAGKATGAARILPFGVFAVFAVGYGFCETMNGNWSQLDLTALHVPATTASLTLTFFWTMVTAGRVLFAVIQRWVPTRLAFHGLPFLLAGAFMLVVSLPAGRAAGLGFVAFGLAGLGCSALLPLMISFGQEKLTAVSASVASWIIACYQFGYGIAAFGVGPLRAAGLTLPEIYTGAAAVAVALGGLSFVIAKGRPSPAALHPRPATPATPITPPRGRDLGRVRSG